VVGQIEWLTIEKSAFPKRRGMQDFGLVDLPYPLRRMSLNILGTLRQRTPGPDSYVFRRGTGALPTVGASVVLPTDDQLRAIVESGDRRRVRIGTSPLAGNAEVCIDPDRLFGRHLAVLGNTGSGKSCSVAGLIRWSVERAQSCSGRQPNARFIILDPNGEYSRAFNDSTGPTAARVFKVEPAKGERLLQAPMWFWSSAEWCSFTQATAKTQRPTLVHALRTAREGRSEPAPSRSHVIRNFLRVVVSTIRVEINAGSPWAGFPKSKGFFQTLENWRASLEPELKTISADEETALREVVDGLEQLCKPRRTAYDHNFTLQEVEALLSVASSAHSAFGGTEHDTQPIDADTPLPFTGDCFLRSVEATAEILNVSEYAETMLMRLRSLMSEPRMKAIIGDDASITLEDWLADYVGADGAPNGCVSIVDLSLVPTEVVHTVTAVIARIVFEALQRYRKLTGQTLPTVLVMEEAHTFIKDYRGDAESQTAASVCCRVFERIAREGRKFGLGLVLSSQRPSELSPTVLSQCNSFLLHRISNDRDQDMVNRLLPDSLRGLLRELPSLPSQSAILLGWASELPVLVRMSHLPEIHRPHSEDPDFWAVWTGTDAGKQEVERRIDWPTVVADWQGVGSKLDGLPPCEAASASGSEHSDDEGTAEEAE
jgi:DNA helicase HerA-like ATPase